MLTRGARLLRTWLHAPGEKRSMEQLAGELGVSRPAISYWLQGVSRPEPHYRERLERVTGVPFGAWYTAAESAIASGTRRVAKTG